MEIFKRHTKKLNRMLLVIYFVSLVAGILHHHPYNFSSLKSVSNEDTSGSHFLQLNSDTNANCIILQNLSNLQTAVVKSICGHQSITGVNIFVDSFISQFCINQFHLNNILLRAPPLFS
jgi:hypothetical protein